MESMNWVEAIAFLASVASLILAVVAIISSKASEKEARENYEKTKDVLAEIDKRAAVIERTVSDSQQKLMETMTNIINETVIPKKADMGEEIGMQFMQQLFSNPQQAGDMMGAIEPLIKIAEAQKNK
ncbi:hypothetical protein [Bacterioplanoides sp.]|uniref:hypothetical protein n=1 Tax=Bacterioplanoides sp. TaxID=2066072 RepID=UPI003B5AD3FD